MQRETKSSRIMKLNAAGKTTREIANIVGCRIEYVRVVVRQRRGKGASENDKRYLASSLGQEFIKRRNEKRRPAINAYSRIFRLTGSRKAAREAYRKALEVAHA